MANKLIKMTVIILKSLSGAGSRTSDVFIGVSDHNHLAVTVRIIETT